MGEINGFKFIIFYIKSRVKIIIAFTLISLIFASVFYLYRIPVEIVGYASLLSIFVCAIFVVLDYINFYKKHRKLTWFFKTIVHDAENMPYAKDIIEEDYQRLVELLYNEKMRIISEENIKRSELVDYYTMWAHQIKTPISAMRLLLQSEDSSQSSTLSIELFKIEQYVEMVLQYLRIDSMSQDLLLKYYSLDEIVRKAIRKYAKIFVMKKIALDFSELDCDVLTDEKWLIFVVEQVLSNALKYTKKGNIKIYMDKTAEKTLVIEDTGIGIKEEDINRVFEKGFTGYNGRLYIKSTGIGLYLCKQIMNKLSHGISIESEIDKGTKVKLDLDTIDLKIE
ncbi:sensor histidine kinase [Clostridium cadaveris]|uniref:sensor histidine kinase n=1 Tax=Clostridium cadaveris TaxID=1529 RepID=UPI00145933E0|nr:sensor histidine kinase [Clostridium cadaveris]NME63035.1 HAMP domain-containing histidine kinase [Clostridium cadaveris]